MFLVLNDTATTEIYTYWHTLSLLEALPILVAGGAEHQIGGEAEQAVAPAHRAALDRFEQEIAAPRLDQLERRGDRGLAILDRALPDERGATGVERGAGGGRSEEHTSELQSLMRISYAVFCLKKNNTTNIR